MSRRSVYVSVTVVGVLAFSITLATLQVQGRREMNRRAFDRGYAAGTCDMVRSVNLDPQARSSPTSELIGWCKAWDGRLKP